MNIAHYNPLKLGKLQYVTFVLGFNTTLKISNASKRWTENMTLQEKKKYIIHTKVILYWICTVILDPFNQSGTIC